MALVTLHRYLVRIVSMGGNQYLFSRLDSGTLDFAIADVLDPVASVLRDAPGSVPAIVILGILGFCGHVPTYKLIRELHVIPPTVDEWVGWLLGCRLFCEYTEWAAGDKKDAFKLTAEVVYNDNNPTHPKITQEVMEMQRQACQLKVEQLMGVFGINGSPGDFRTVEEIMSRFPNYYLTYAKTFGRVDVLLVKHEEELSRALGSLDVTKAAQKARAESERSGLELADARTKLAAAEASERQIRVELQRLQEKADAAKQVFDTRKEHFEQKGSSK